MLPRCGRAAHVCEANRNCTMKRNKNLRENRKNRNCLQNREVVMRMQGFRGNCDSQGKLGMCPSLAEPNASGFPRAEFSGTFSIATVSPKQLQDASFPVRFHKAERSCSPRLEKLSLFSPPSPCAKRMAQGFRCLRAAIRATRPEPRQHF